MHLAVVVGRYRRGAAVEEAALQLLHLVEGEGAVVADLLLAHLRAVLAAVVVGAAEELRHHQSHHSRACLEQVVVVEEGEEVVRLRLHSQQQQSLARQAEAAAAVEEVVGQTKPEQDLHSCLQHLPDLRHLPWRFLQQEQQEPAEAAVVRP